MNDTDLEPTRTPQTNEDPISHEHGAHPVATGIGAAGGGMAGGALGLAIGGPIGGAIGAVIGALAGGLGGSAAGEAIEPTIEASDPLVFRGSDPSHGVSAGAAAAGEDSEEPVPWHEVIPSGLPSYEEIAVSAYYRYEQEGRPEGQSLRHWLAAEESLRSEAAVI